MGLGIGQALTFEDLRSLVTLGDFTEKYAFVETTRRLAKKSEIEARLNIEALSGNSGRAVRKEELIALSIGNEIQSQEFQRNNCSAGSTGTYFTYTIPANTYFAETLIEANNLALADISTNGQNEANLNGYCILDTVISIGVIDVNNSSDADLYMRVNTSGVSNPSVTDIVYRTQNYYEVGSPAAEAFMLASSKLVGTTTDRFEVNIGKLIGMYPLINEFIFELCGRNVAGGAIGGVYALKYPNQKMTMIDSSGVLTPSVTPAGGPATSAWSGFTINGADGNIFPGMGNIIKTWTYNKTNNTFLPS